MTKTVLKNLAFGLLGVGILALMVAMATGSRLNVHPDELDLARRGLLTFRDLETGGRLIAHTEEIRAAYADAMRAHVAGLRSFATRRGIDYVLATTTSPHLALFDRLT